MKRLKFDYFFYIVIVLLLLLLAAATRAQTDKKHSVKVKIYLLDTFESPDLLTTLELLPVERRVGARFPLRSTLKALAAGATDEEESQNLRSPFAGIDLISVRVKNKTAFANFTRTEKTKLGKYEAMRFRNAVLYTALQFPSIKRIVICLNGASDFWLIDAITHAPC